MERILIAPTEAVVDLSLENILFEEFFFNRTCYYNLPLVDVILAVCRRIVEADL